MGGPEVNLIGENSTAGGGIVGPRNSDRGGSGPGPIRIGSPRLWWSISYKGSREGREGGR